MSIYQSKAVPYADEAPSCCNTAECQRSEQWLRTLHTQAEYLEGCVARLSVKLNKFLPSGPVQKLAQEKMKPEFIGVSSFATEVATIRDRFASVFDSLDGIIRDVEA